eukprot:468078_1
MNAMRGVMPTLKAVPRTSKLNTKCTAKQMKSNENTCRKHLFVMLQKLSQYNDKTQDTMKTKLDEKYNKQFEQARNELKSNPTKFKMEQKRLAQQKAKDWQQYKKTIANKVLNSWKDNVIKLQHKFASIIDDVIPKVQKEYLQQHPNDTTIIGLLASSAL